MSMAPVPDVLPIVILVKPFWRRPISVVFRLKAPVASSPIPIVVEAEDGCKIRAAGPVTLAPKVIASVVSVMSPLVVVVMVPEAPVVIDGASNVIPAEVAARAPFTAIEPPANGERIVMGSVKVIACTSTAPVPEAWPIVIEEKPSWR